jgi:hypothetical protein
MDASRRVAVLALAASCATQAELRDAPIAIEGAAETLRSGQAASLITTDDQSVTVRPDQVVDVITIDHRRLTRTLAAVVNECVVPSADADHLCELRGIEAIVLGARRAPSTAGHTIRQIAIATVGIGAAAALTYCADVCASPYDGLAIAVGVLEVAGFIVWAWLSSKD